MKIKKYVRASNFIFDTYNDNDLALFMQIETKNPLSNYYGDLYKTSNNILELAQKGDMVEYAFGNKTTTKYVDDYGIQDIKYIIALWVRQDETTFKRYEVK